jgi:nicotinate phosphoribosyltransferase
VTQALLTDFYEVTIARAYFEEGRQDETAVFDLFYRTQPFHGSFAIVAGISEAIKFIRDYKITEDQLAYLKANLPGVSDEFIDYLRHVDTTKLKIVGPREGSIVFPREPLLRVEGPIAYCQLIETPLLNCLNFPTLMATNAARFKMLVGNRGLMEFGLRRAQGPDGAMYASRYSYLGGFDSTSNILAGQLFNIPISGTVAHSFISSFHDMSQLKTTCIPHRETKEPVDLLKYAEQCLKDLDFHTNRSELAAMIAQAQVYPTNFLALADTYDSLKSGVPNFLAVAYGLEHAGYRGRGLRLDSGDLAELSKQTRALFNKFADFYHLEYARKFVITASNDINEQVLLDLKRTGHELDLFGIGTHLVTCQAQPALGGVYKLVQINGVPRVKLSNSIEKVTLPGKKELYRLFDAEGKQVADILTMDGEPEPQPGTIEAFQVYPGTGKMTLTFARVEKMYANLWDQGKTDVETLQQARTRCLEQVRGGFRSDVVRIEDPTLYTVTISMPLHKMMDDLIKANHDF